MTTKLSHLHVSCDPLTQYSILTMLMKKITWTKPGNKNDIITHKYSRLGKKLLNQWQDIYM